MDWDENVMNVDTLLLALVQHQDADAAIRALNDAGFLVTLTASVGGFTGASNATLLIGLTAPDVARALDVLKTSCQPRTVTNSRNGVTTSVTVGGATIFAFPVARYVHLNADRTCVDARVKPSEPGRLQLVLAIIPQEQSEKAAEALTNWSYHATVISTTGGFFRRGQATIMVGARSERVDSIVTQLYETCKNWTEPMATIFVLDIDRLEHI